jgi:hypothetical protein
VACNSVFLSARACRDQAAADGASTRPRHSLCNSTHHTTYRCRGLHWGDLLAATLYLFLVRMFLRGKHLILFGINILVGRLLNSVETSRRVFALTIRRLLGQLLILPTFTDKLIQNRVLS